MIKARTNELIIAGKYIRLDYGNIDTELELVFGIIESVFEIKGIKETFASSTAAINMFAVMIKKQNVIMAKEKKEKKVAAYEVKDKLLSYKLKYKPMNDKQASLIKLIKHKELTCVKGAAGSGKSYITLAVALELLKGSNAFDQILIIVPTVQIDEIGFIKGDLEDKIAPHADADKYTIEKILTKSGNTDAKKMVADLIKAEKIKFEPVSFLRGKTLDNKIVCISESANLTPDFIFTILTRIGENSKYIFSGDPTQCDRKKVKPGNDGLSVMIRNLQEMPEIGFCEFTNEDIVRNPIITKIIDCWEKNDKSHKSKLKNDAEE